MNLQDFGLARKNSNWCTWIRNVNGHCKRQKQQNKNLGDKKVLSYTHMFLELQPKRLPLSKQQCDWGCNKV